MALRFGAMLAVRDVNAPGPWLADAERFVLRDLAAGIGRDLDAVLAARCFLLRNGQVEGQVHCITGVMRSMFGRANFDLLRARLLGAA